MHPRAVLPYRGARLFVHDLATRVNISIQLALEKRTEMETSLIRTSTISAILCDNFGDFVK